MDRSEGLLVIGAVGKDAWSHFLSDAADERRAEDVTTKVLTDGGSADDHEKVSARHGLKQEIIRERRQDHQRRRRTYDVWSAFSWRHRSCV